MFRAWRCGRWMGRKAGKTLFALILPFYFAWEAVTDWWRGFKYGFWDEQEDV